MIADTFIIATPSGVPQGAAMHHYKHAKDTNRFTSLANGLMKFLYRPLPQAGAEQYAFTRLALPEERVQGYGTQVQGQIQAFQAGLWAQQTVLDTGLGGLIHGQAVSQNLIDMWANAK